MAKMFYTLEEAAERLGKTAEQVKAMANSGKLQQFRDRDKLMFKRDEVDGIAGKPGDSSGDSDAIDLAGDSKGPGASKAGDSMAGKKKEDPRQATGVSVFDADEVEQADPLAQTQVTAPQSGAQEEELALESVGSGSGLLDLTRESDDTSLGAELLDEIYPAASGSAAGATAAGTEASDAKMDSGVSATAAGTTASAGGTTAGSSGVFDGAMALESGPSGLENMQATEPNAGAGMGPITVYEEAPDPAGSGLTTGMLLGVFAVLTVGLFVAFSTMFGATSVMTSALATQQLPIYVGAAVVVCLVFGGVGFFLGKAMSK